WCAVAPASAAAEETPRSLPIPHRSCRLHSEDYRGDTAVEWFRSTSCAPVSFANQMDTQAAEITQFILGRTLMATGTGVTDAQACLDVRDRSGRRQRACQQRVAVVDLHQHQASPALPAGVVLPVQSPQPARRSGSLPDPARHWVRTITYDQLIAVVMPPE